MIEGFDLHYRQARTRPCNQVGLSFRVVDWLTSAKSALRESLNPSACRWWSSFPAKKWHNGTTTRVKLAIGNFAIGNLIDRHNA